MLRLIPLYLMCCFGVVSVALTGCSGSDDGPTDSYPHCWVIDTKNENLEFCCGGPPIRGLEPCVECCKSMEEQCMSFARSLSTPINAIMIQVCQRDLANPCFFRCLEKNSTN
jgi:hypothetical protein